MLRYKCWSPHCRLYFFPFFLIHPWAPHLKHKQTELESGWAVVKAAILPRKCPVGLRSPWTLASDCVGGQAEARQEQKLSSEDPPHPG